MPTPFEFIAKVAPQINLDFSTGDKNIFIGIAENEVNPSLFSDSNNKNLAISYYACHLMALSKRDDNSRGVLTSEKEGELSRNYSSNYSSNSSTNSSTNTTQYLDSYNRMLESRVVPLFIINDDY